MGDDSLPRRVTSVARGRERLVRVALESGDSFVCNLSHVLSLRCVDLVTIRPERPGEPACRVTYHTPVMSCDPLQPTVVAFAPHDRDFGKFACVQSMFCKKTTDSIVGQQRKRKRSIL